MTYNLDKNAARRLGQAVKRSERGPLNKPHASRGRGRGGSSNDGFWAELTGQNVGKYSWQACRLNKTTLKIEKDPDGETGDHTKETGFAVEMRHKSGSCVVGDTVWLTPAPDADCYIFDYDGTFKIGSISADVEPNMNLELARYSELRRIDDDKKLIGSQQVRIYNAYSKKVRVRGSGYVQLMFTDGVWIVIGADCQ